MHPTLYSIFANERIAGFRREAAADRLAALATAQPRPTLGGRTRPDAGPGWSARRPAGT